MALALRPEGALLTYDPYKPPQLDPAASYLGDGPLAPGFRPSHAGLAASLFLGGAVAVEAVGTVLYFLHLDPDVVERLDVVVRSISGLGRLGGVVAFLMWTHRVVSNARAFGTHAMRTSPGRAVGYWFVPFFNLVHGYRVVCETWLASDPESAREDGASLGSSTPPGIILHWWLAYVASRVAVTACRLSWSETAYVLASVFEIAAFVLMAIVIRRLDVRQHARARAVRWPVEAQ